MKIRSITYFFNPGFPLDRGKLRRANDFLRTAQTAYRNAGYDVQTTRLATPSFTKILGESRLGETPALANQFASAMEDMVVEYASLGPALMEFPASYSIIPEAIAASENIFFSGEMASAEKGISLPAIRACADVIVRAAPLHPNGFANLRFTALANVPAGGPFFPAAYHAGDAPAFALALEAADLAVDAFRKRETVEAGRRRLVAALERHGRTLTKISNSLPGNFLGLDFSLAPFPDDAISLGGAIEKFGVPKVGLHGSLAAAAILAESIQNADFPHIGFNGMMMPVLEDSVLAKRAAEGVLTVKDLLLYSAVCGTGLDTVPLAGDVSREQIGALLLDIAALALRLAKPLTARLMPIPGKQAGDRSEFDFAFFANSRVMALESAGLQHPFNGAEIIQLLPRHKSRL
ncbi:MAG: DUF711 family protein [Anaerolineales bacterium]|nr:DUF711 family protein [Anaerolineales bacterium]